MTGGQICALTFLSIHDVMHAEKILKSEGLAVRLIPVPKQISPECGMALQVGRRELRRAHELLTVMKSKMKNVYLVEGTAFQPLEEGS